MRKSVHCASSTRQLSGFCLSEEDDKCMVANQNSFNTFIVLMKTLHEVNYLCSTCNFI